MTLATRFTIVSAMALIASSPAWADDATDVLDAAGVQGGLIVCLECGDGQLAAELAKTPGCLVLGLDRDADNVRAARERIRSLELTDKASIDRWRGPRLPLIDGLARLIVISRPLDINEQELLRSLAPGGVLCVKKNGAWSKKVKAVPEEIDQWTHYMHDASGNAVAEDSRIGPPRHMQWKASPEWSRSHHTLASVSAMVTSGGRIFYILDEGSMDSIAEPGQWSLAARDAFSGVMLWQRSVPTWAWHRRKFRSGPVQLPRTLVADGDRVYATLGIDAPLSALDAATGETLQTYEGTGGVEEVILHEGVLLILTGSPETEQAAVNPNRQGKPVYPNNKSIVAIDIETDRRLWTWTETADARVMPLTLAANDDRAFLVTGSSVLCLNVRSGEELWSTEPPGAVAAKPKSTSRRGGKGPAMVQRALAWSVATLLVADDVVLSADGKTLSAFSAHDGRLLWQSAAPAGFKSPVDVFVTGGLVWTGPGFAEGRDLHSGEIIQSNTSADDIWTVGHHHRCYREKATSEFILTGKRGIEFLDLDSGDHTRNNWIRGLCQYGILPANGLIYAPPHACSCFMEAKLYGFWAVAAERGDAEQAIDPDAPGLLEKGPAFGHATPDSSLTIPTSTSWPTLRHDPLRSGSTPMVLPKQLATAWSTDVGGRLTPPVVAEGVVLVASTDERRVIALDGANGAVQWEYTPGGRVDSPPTIYSGKALFGCADGWVYCLRLGDGKLVWRYHAAPVESKTVALDQLESLWPVHGSVLIEDDVVYFSAGRSSYLDGGIYLVALDPVDGRVIHRSRITSEHPAPMDQEATEGGSDIEYQQLVQNATDFKTFLAPDRSDGFSMEGVTNDVLTSDGRSIFLRHMCFSREGVRQPQSRHLFSTSRLVDGWENHRSHWILGTGDFSRTPVAYSWIAYGAAQYGSRLSVPYGLMLTYDDETVWGVRRNNKGVYRLFADDNRPFAADEKPLRDFRPISPDNAPSWTWDTELAMHPQAMLRAADTLLVAGLPGADTPGGLLLATSTTDGSIQAEYPLPSGPVWNGLAAADGRVYVSTTDGGLVCLAKE